VTAQKYQVAVSNSFERQLVAASRSNKMRRERRRVPLPAPACRLTIHCSDKYRRAAPFEPFVPTVTTIMIDVRVPGKPQ
jgi:hypothetical protein